VILLFDHVLTDQEIRQDLEEIYPEWAQLIKPHLEIVQRLPPPLAETILRFVGEASYYHSPLTDLDPRQLQVSFLLGAGASKPGPSNIPTVTELLPQLLERGRRLDREDVTKLADFCERRKIHNIEDLLTAAQLATFCSRNPIVLALLNYLLSRGEQEEPYRARRIRELGADLASVAFLQDTLQVLFGLLSSTMLPAKPNEAHNAIAQYASQHPGSAIVTTNYDCCMDLAIGHEGKDFVYGLDFANVQRSGAGRESCTGLIKLHGSLNWFYCETCQEVQLTDIRQMVKDFLEDKAPYPVIGICRDCGGQRRGLLVPPLAIKFDVAPPLTPLADHAKSAFERSNLVVVVGFSFAEADIYISRMLSKSMQTSSERKLLICDPDREVAEKVRRRFKASIPNFDASRVLPLVGDCAEVLPKFLCGELASKEDKSGGKVPREKVKASGAEKKCTTKRRSGTSNDK
jgi:NAD-dependent SIR2 family protein deacetylase